MLGSFLRKGVRQKRGKIKKARTAGTGHAGIKTVVDRYAHVTDESILKEIQTKMKLGIVEGRARFHKSINLYKDQ